VAVRSATPEDAAAYDGTRWVYDPPEYSVTPSSDKPIWEICAVIRSTTSSRKAIRESPCPCLSGCPVLQRPVSANTSVRAVVDEIVCAVVGGSSEVHSVDDAVG